MKKIVLVVSFLFCGYLCSDVLAKNDTVQVQALKTKLEKMEKKVDQLQTEVKTLRTENAKKETPVRKRKVVIDRRGSKQVYLQ